MSGLGIGLVGAALVVGTVMLFAQAELDYDLSTTGTDEQRSKTLALVLILFLILSGLGATAWLGSSWGWAHLALWGSFAVIVMLAVYGLSGTQPE